MPVYRLDLEYDGSGFSGWQVQPGRRTVQGVLSAALERLCGAPVAVQGAGRTDAGVHALGQVASFEAEREIEPQRLLRALAGLLPKDVRVGRGARCSPGFEARFSALERAYTYRMLRHPSALGRGLHHVLRVRVDVEPMAEAAALLLGEHDFTAFARGRSSIEHPVSRILAAEVSGSTSSIRFDVAANRFLHNMVRRLAGVLVEVGRGRLAPAEVARIVADRDRSRGGPCLPACGLYLVRASYPSDPEFERSAVVDAPPWAP